MNEETIRKELQRIDKDLRELLEIVSQDCGNESDRYNIGVLVGIEYARRELERLGK